MANFSLDDLLNLQPSVVSRDLTGYITYLYGAAKVGKTTLAKEMGALILACEDGTRAMSGAYAQIMQSWSDIRLMARLLKDPRMKEKYKAIAVDTVDIAAALCEKYICSQHGVDKLGEIPYGGGWSAFKKEFEDVFRGISLQGYAVLFISHDKEKIITRQNGTEYTKIVPTVSDSINNIVKNMSDIIAYGYQEAETEDRYMILRSDGSVEAGTRFPYMASKIPFGYKYLVEALNKAIDEEEKHNGSDAVTSSKIVRTATAELDFDSLIGMFNETLSSLMDKEGEEQFNFYWAPRIVEITERYLGKGKKVNTCTRDQVEQLCLIVDELNDLVQTHQ